jgi:hypothetical protein
MPHLFSPILNDFISTLKLTTGLIREHCMEFALHCLWGFLQLYESYLPHRLHWIVEWHFSELQLIYFKSVQ